MSGRTFAQINASLLRSKKIKGCNHSEKWAYICAHLTPLAGFSGQFRYPLAMWSLDADLDLDELGEAIYRLTQIGLIEYDDDEEFIRIVGFHRQRPTENASRAISRVGDFEAMELENERCVEMWLSGVAEFIVAAVKRAQAWKPDSADWPKLRDTLKGFMRRVYQEQGDAFLTPLVGELEDAGKAVKGELISIFPHLDSFMQTPCPHPEVTVSTQGEREGEESKRDTETEKEKERDTILSPEFSSTSTSARTEGVELLRKGDEPNRSVPSLGPLESTKRSALVMGIK